MTEIEETMVEIRPLLRIIARERVGAQSWLLEDAEQEAMIAAWTRLAEGRSIGIAVHNAKQAVIDVVRGSRATGSKAAGVNLGAHHRAVPLTLPGADGSEDYTLEPADPGAEAAYDELEQEEILAALLAALTPTQAGLVRERLDGLTTREIAERRGMTHQGVSYHLKKARQRLAPFYPSLRAA